MHIYIVAHTSYTTQRAFLGYGSGNDDDGDGDSDEGGWVSEREKNVRL